MTGLGNEDLILGYPWLSMFEPQFNWTSGAIDSCYFPCYDLTLKWMVTWHCTIWPWCTIKIADLNILYDTQDDWLVITSTPSTPSSSMSCWLITSTETSSRGWSIITIYDVLVAISDLRSDFFVPIQSASELSPPLLPPPPPCLPVSLFPPPCFSVKAENVKSA